MLELSVLIVSILLILICIYYTSNQYSFENFENYYLNSCPSGYKTFYNNNSDVSCCDGDIVSNKCIGNNKCTLTGLGTEDMPNCTKIIYDDYKSKSISLCPSSMPQYFENKGNKIKGCISGELNSTLDGPRNVSQSMCKIYKEDIKNYTTKDSCHIQKQLDELKCFGDNCTKNIVQPIPNGPILIAVGFTDKMGIHHTAYSRDTLINFLNQTNPTWRESGFDIDRNIQSADVSKAFYIDRTIDGKNIQWYM